MDEEISSLYKNNTWDGLTASEPRKFKARLVVKSYPQKEKVDFKEVFHQ